MIKKVTKKAASKKAVKKLQQRLKLLAQRETSKRMAATTLLVMSKERWKLASVSLSRC